MKLDKEKEEKEQHKEKKTPEAKKAAAVFGAKWSPPSDITAITDLLTQEDETETGEASLE